MKTTTEATVTRTETGIVIEQTETERVSPAYAPFETVFRKTAEIVVGSGGRRYAYVRTTRNGIVTGVHHFPANDANRGTLAFFVGDELADELLAAVPA